MQIYGLNNSKHKCKTCENTDINTCISTLISKKYSLGNKLFNCCLSFEANFDY